jgi:translation elongation factor EF-Ts
MSKISAKDTMALTEATDCDLLGCKRALEAAKGDKEITYKYRDQYKYIEEDRA